MTSFNVILGNTNINNKQFYELHEVNSNREPIISFNKNPNKLYTYAMIDVSIPFVNTYGKSEWLHWLVVNDDQVVVDYAPPTPPAGSSKHKYYICVYEQEKQIKTTKMTGSRENRLNFSMSDFVHNNKLKCIFYIMFITEWSN
jgi:phosphatidylethanolamine-binding protein (PEBP) family uncharacterized protein